MASIQLRQLIDNILSDTSRDMREQCDTVDVCFQKRLEEMEDSKSKMEENLRKVQVLNSYYTASSHPVLLKKKSSQSSYHNWYSLKTCSFFRSVMKLPRWRRTLICLERPLETRRIQWRFPRLGWTTARIGQVWSSAGTQYSTSKQAYPTKSGITGNIVFSFVI